MCMLSRMHLSESVGGIGSGEKGRRGGGEGDDILTYDEKRCIRQERLRTSALTVCYR